MKGMTNISPCRRSRKSSDANWKRRDVALVRTNDMVPKDASCGGAVCFKATPTRLKT